MIDRWNQPCRAGAGEAGAGLRTAIPGGTTTACGFCAGIGVAFAREFGRSAASMGWGEGVGVTSTAADPRATGGLARTATRRRGRAGAARNTRTGAWAGTGTAVLLLRGLGGWLVRAGLGGTAM